MSVIRSVIFSTAAVLCAIVLLTPLPGLADDDHDRKKKRHGRRTGVVAVPPVYRDNCGACHLAYPPGLLPGRSWSRIMASPADHHGEEIELEKGAADQIAAYLQANAADVSGWKRSRKIMSSLGSATPLRVTQVPYIIRKHQDDDIPAGAFGRKSVGSMANCKACHPGAEQGDFDDDRVRIPAP